MDHPLHMLWDRAVIAAMTFLLMYLYRLAPCKFSAFVRIAIQMSLLSYWYPDTFEFNQNHRIISEIAHVERLAHPHLRKCMTEPYGRLSAEHPLLGRSKQMIQIGEDVVLFHLSVRPV